MSTSAPIAIHGLHHNAYRCSDSERTRRFYEDLLGLPLVGAIEIHQTKTGRSTRALHTFFRLGDGSCLAFFEVPGMPFEFKTQHDFDLHIALEVALDCLEAMRSRAQRAGVEVRGISDHGFIRSIYLRDPDGYVIELTAKASHDDPVFDAAQARSTLEAWQRHKQSVPYGSMNA